MTDDQIDLRDCERRIRQQRIQITAIGGALISLLDVFAQVLESRDVAARSEIGGRLREIVDRERQKNEQDERERDALRTLPLESRLPFPDIESNKIQHALIEAFIARLLAPTASPKPDLRLIIGGMDGAA